MNQKEINRQIFKRLDKLESSVFGGDSQKEIKLPKDNAKKFKGATGGLRVLVDEDYFNNPKQLPETIERLKQEGRHYSNATISMGLLSLVRERVLTRFRDKGDKKWKYVIRK
ncbi:MAG: hypothetical protein Q8N88_05070 [Nanoarchaeota archaeon]|nr:hypothetical protein [Nanoarchaeota archaeon]